MATSITSYLYINFNRDGSWNYTWFANGHDSFNIVGSQYYDTPASAGGYWHINPSGTVGDQFEVYFDVSDNTGNIGESTSATYRQRRARAGTYAIGGVAFQTWHSLAANRQIYLGLVDNETPFGAMPQGSTLDVIAAMNCTAYVRVAGGGGQQVGAGMSTLQSMLRWNRASPGGGGGGGCVHADSYVRYNQTARGVTAGDWLRCMKSADEFDFLPASSNRPEYQDCVRITMRTGASLVVSKTTPLTLRDNSSLLVAALQPGTQLPVFYEADPDRPEPFWDTVDTVEHVGMLEVALISVGGHCYAAGEKRGAYIYTHNMAEQKN